MPDNQPEYKGFCFNCPHFSSELTDNKQLLLNPWPLLAANPSLHTVKANPLIRAFYFYSYSRDPFSSIYPLIQKQEGSIT